MDTYTLTDGSKVEVVDGKIEVPQPHVVESISGLSFQKKMIQFRIDDGKVAEEELAIINEKLELLK